MKMPDENERFRKIRKLTAGAGTRSSQRTNASNDTAAMTAEPVINVLPNHPLVSPSSRRVSNATSPTAIKPIPIPSIRWNPRRSMYAGSLMNCQPMIDATIPTGRLMKKIQGQE